jgi:hypothetical protein
MVLLLSFGHETPGDDRCLRELAGTSQRKRQEQLGFSKASRPST